MTEQTDARTSQEQRAAWIEAQRWLHGRLEADTALPISPDMDGAPASPHSIYLNGLYGKQARDALAAWEDMLRAEGTSFDGKPGSVTGASDPYYWDLEWEIFGTPMRVRFTLTQVAEKRVTGTRVVEDLEWVRLPALDENPEGAEAA